MEELSCVGCGACCRAGVGMALDRAGVLFMQNSGTMLKENLPASPDIDWAEASVEEITAAVKDPLEIPMSIMRAGGLEPGEGYFRLVKDCGNLVMIDGWEQCRKYTDPSRPAICQDFVVGSNPCMTLRVKKGVDPPRHIIDMDMPLLNSMDFSSTSEQYANFYNDEMAFLQAQNHWLEPLMEGLADHLERLSGGIAREFRAGMLLGHRILRIANDNQPLPERHVQDIETFYVEHALKDQRENRPAGSSIDSSFKELFAGNPNFLEFTFHDLVIQRSRQALVLLFQLYRDSIDPLTFQINE